MVSNECMSSDALLNNGFSQSNNGIIIAPPTNLDRRVTSIHDPYRLVNIAHIVLDPQYANSRGRLSISICPGKKDSRWNRNLPMDLHTIKGDGIEVIVCLLEWSEMRMLNVTDYPKRAQEEGILFYHLPIRDRGVPQQKETNVLVPLIVQQLVAGKHVLVHCRGGLGRAGMICACCLGHFGYTGKDAIDMVRKQRPGAIQTMKQEESVIQYCQTLLTGF